MSARTLTFTALVCDGCGTDIDGLQSGGYDNVMEARAAAYGLGWRFPNRINEAGRTIKNTSDVCPNCIGDWKPQVRQTATWTPRMRQHMADMAAARARRKADAPQEGGTT